MKALATLVMRGRMQAIMMTTVFGVLSLFLPPLSYISGGVVALVTLRRGPNDGIAVMLVSALLMAIVSTIAVGHYVIAVAYTVAVWLPVLILAIVLRKTISLPLALSAAGLLGIIGVVALHVLTQ